MEKVKTEAALHNEYVKAVGAVEEAEAAIHRAQAAYDEACRRRNDAQAKFIKAKIAADKQPAPKGGSNG